MMYAWRMLFGADLFLTLHISIVTEKSIISEHALLDIGTMAYRSLIHVCQKSCQSVTCICFKFDDLTRVERALGAVLNDRPHL